MAMVFGEYELLANSGLFDLNVCMTWVSYPGRTNGTATAEQVDFATPGGKLQCHDG